MNKPLLNALCASLLAGTGSNLGRADDGSATVAPRTMMAVAVAPSAGAVVIEASTNLVDWADVTMLFPSDAEGLFLDTESTNYNYRFYRMRSIVSAANNLVTVSTLADLRTLSAISGNADVAVRGYYGPGDGGGGSFFWDAGSTDNDDGGVTIIPSSNPSSGRWKRSIRSEVNVKWFGAVGNGVENDMPMIQAALDYVDRQGGGKVFLPSGSYALAGGNDWLKVGNDTLLEGAGTSTVLLSTADRAICNKNSDTPGSGNHNITIQNLAINCGKKGMNGVVFFAVSDSTVHNVRILDPQGYGMWLFRWGDGPQGEGRPTTRVTVSNCHISGVVDTGIECSGAVACTITGNTVTGTSGIAAYYAWNGATDCVFTGNVAEGEGTNNYFKGYEVQPTEVTGSPVPAAKRTQTQRISFVGNVARNVFIGVRIRGTPDNKPTDILVEGNSLSGIGFNDCAVQMWDALRVSVLANRISGFDHGFCLNEFAGDHNGAGYITIDNNTISGGRGSFLYGNVGGSLNGNKFYGQSVHSVWMYAWKNCAVNNNMFVNLGLNQDTVGIMVLGDDGVGATGNNFSGNTCMDDRVSKFTGGAVVFDSAGHDYNIVCQNNARGSKPGAKAFTNLGSGTNNIVADNIDGY